MTNNENRWYEYTAESEDGKAVEGVLSSQGGWKALKDELEGDCSYTSVKLVKVYSSDPEAKSQETGLVTVHNLDENKLAELPDNVRGKLAAAVSQFTGQDLTVGETREVERDVMEEYVDPRTHQVRLRQKRDQHGMVVREKVQLPALMIDAGPQQPQVTINSITFDAKSGEITSMDAKADEWPPRGEGFGG